MADTILITGANRGLGLEFVRQYAKTEATIFACCRLPDEAQELHALQKQYPHIQIYSLDVSSQDSIQSLANKIQDPIDILINNAGMLERDPPLGSISTQVLVQTFLVNAVAPLKMTEAFIQHLTKGKKKILACISSSMGSISDNTSGGYYSYRAAKAALNMLMKSAGVDLAPLGIKVLLLHPGWVKTRMGGADAMIDPQTSITGMRKVIENYESSEGEVKFYRYNGEIVPW